MRWSAAGVLFCFGAFAACTESMPVRSVATPDIDSLITLATETPDSVRDGIARAMLGAASAPTEHGGAFDEMRWLARAYAEAWKDSFFIRRVDAFIAASPAERRTIVAADSVWRSGRTAMGQEGVPAAMHLWRRSLRLAESAGDSASQARALYSLGAGFSSLGESDSAIVYLDRAHMLATVVGDQRSVGNTLGILANVSRDRGDRARAAELYEQALTVRQRSGDARGMAADYNNLGLVARELGDLERAHEAFERALELNRAGRNQRALAVNLTNLGDIASVRGEYSIAGESYEEALAINRAAGDSAETGFVLHDLGLLSARRGDYSLALEYLAEAIAVHDRSGASHEAISARVDLATVQGAVGSFDSARVTLRQAETAASASESQPAVVARLSLAQADLAAQLGSYEEAHAQYARAEQLFRAADDDAGRAEAQQGSAMLLHMRDDYEGALRQLDLAARVLEEAADPRAAALTLLLAGDVHRARGDTVAARLASYSALHTLRALGDAAGESAALLALGDLALQQGAPLAAEELYNAGLQRLAEHRVPDLRWRLHAGLAAALRSRGALAPAAAQLHVAIAAIEDMASGVRAGEQRAVFLTDKWQVYGTLAAVEQQRARPVESFEISERMRARQMLATLGHGRVLSNRPASVREQDLRRRITELGRLIEGDDGQRDAQRERPLAQQSVGAAREALDAAQREYAELLLTMRDNLPEYTRLVSSPPIDWRAIANRLAPDEILVQYLLTDSASLAFVVNHDTVTALELDVHRHTIANLVDFARHTMDRPAATDQTQLWRGALRRLHHYLIGPVERAGLLNGTKRLVVVPHAELHFLPFGALLGGPGEGEFLVQRFELTYAGSAGVWLHMADVPRARSRRVLAFAPDTARLPASLDEVAAIRDLRGRRNATVLIGDDATERALRTAAPRYGILHLATSGILNKHNPLFSWVELARGGGQDGRLEVHEVYDLELAGQTVVLSACQTALGAGHRADVPPGDDWVGLMQAFVQAGAASVVASLWAVDDRASATLMERFYEALGPGRSEAAALAEAQRRMLRDSATAHPFYWAAFIATGANGN